ncbi:hypothetical protein AAVH_02276 [Aphelenchoides avenae]|nr:hypothetical protein AAVH_02276 [Aphelenchus avenae]
MYDDWPVLEFTEVKPSILEQFSEETGETVSHLLIAELVENVDRPASAGVRLEREQDLEWIMQVINHAFSLPFRSTRDYETIRAAVRIYLAWSTALTSEVHKACPKSLREQPGRYFRKILDALRALFLPRRVFGNDASVIARQGNEIRNVLTALRHLTSGTSLVDEYRDEVWSRCLLFLMASTDQLLAQPAGPEEIGSVMAADLAQTLFELWVQAALHELIPSPSYWKTLSTLCRKWIIQVPVIECWARELLPLTVLLVQSFYGKAYCNIRIANERSLQCFGELNEDGTTDTLREAWHRFLHLFGNPARFLQYGDEFMQNYNVSQAAASYYSAQASLSFFYAVVTICKMVDLFYGDPTIVIDFHESDELLGHWMDARRALLDESSKLTQQNSSHRSSNLSTTSTSGTSHNGTGEMNGTGTLTHQSLAMAHGNAAAVALGGLPAGTAAYASQKRPAFNQSMGSTRSSNYNGVTNGQQRMANESLFSDAASDIPKPRPGQFVWYSLRNNKLRPPHKPVGGPRSTSVLDVFMPWLLEPACVQLPHQHRKYSEDVMSHKSDLSSTEVDSQHMHSSVATSSMAGDRDHSTVTRRSFANSTTSSSDVSSPYASAATSSFDFPSVDGVAAGKAAALGALCRIVCNKSSREIIPDDQLAQFYAAVHEALIERDRLMMCSILFYSSDLFKLGLRGVEILLPNYLMAIDIIFTESLKLKLHPSIHEIEMRHVTLRCLASLIAWPTTFGTHCVVASSTDPKLVQGHTNLLETSLVYADLRPRLLRILVHALRNEMDATNLQLALSLCYVFCEESARYDLAEKDRQVLKEKPTQKRSVSDVIAERQNSDSDETNKYYAVSVMRGVVSAICDNLCKTQWASELTIALASFDCLNSLASLPQTVLFHKKDLSTGSLIVTSICRFIDAQLQKPPPHHSRDLHSSVVAAFSTLRVWLNAAPMLTEIESCLNTVAQTIELGMTGGKGLTRDGYKPASQRVYDAADGLLHALFASLASTKDSTPIDEQQLTKKYNVHLDRFKHFLVFDNTLISVHEATHIESLSRGLPTVLVVARSISKGAHAYTVQLRPRLRSRDRMSMSDQENRSLTAGDAQSPGGVSVLSTISGDTDSNSSGDKGQRKSLEQQTTVTAGLKHFELSPDILTAQCKLDLQSPPLEPTPEVTRIQKQLAQIKQRMAHGSSGVDDRDANNAWVQSSLGALLSMPPRPEDPAKKCNAVRIFLYDLGLINRATFGKSLVPLDSSRTDVFYKDLHGSVDRAPVRTIATVSMFYVRDGQRAVVDILDNGNRLENTSPEFCRLIAELGRGVDVHSHPHWTGHWDTAFSKGHTRNGVRSTTPADHYTLDGTQNCLWWSDQQMEIAFVMPTDRSLPTGGSGDLLSAAPVSVATDLHPESDRCSQVSPGKLSTHSQSSRANNGSLASYSREPSSMSGNNIRTSTNMPQTTRTKSSSTINSEGSTAYRGVGVVEKPAKRCADLRIFVVWLERVEDMYHFPYDRMLEATETGSESTSKCPDFIAIYLHSFEAGLVRVHTEGIWTKYGQPGPLQDGMVVSTAVVSSLLRQTVASIARRKVVEVDNYQATHLKRRQVILDFAKKYTLNANYTDFLDKFISF